MPIVEVREQEKPDSFIRRFKRIVEKSGRVTKAKKNQFFEKPAKKRQREKQAAIKRWQKFVSRDSISNRRRRG